MKANPSKFQAIVFKCRKNEEVLDLNIGDELIKPVSLVKLLGVLIDYNLSFNEHVSKLCVKAARQTNALRRIVKYIPNECRLKIYQAFISLNFNYCDVVWPFCSNRSTYKIEKVHKNALRVTLNDYMSSYLDMLEVVKRPTLYISRIINIAIETFKSVKGLNPKHMGSLFSFSTTPYCTRGGSKLVQPKVNTISFGINSFAYQGSKIWNNLPQGVKDTTCLIACKDLIVQWEGPTCECGFCIMCNMSKISTSLFLRIIVLCCVSHTMDICICILIYTFPARQPCPWYEIWSSDCFSFGFWYMYVPFPVAVSCSFLLLVTPSSLICTFSPSFSLCRLIALGQCYLFVIGATKNKVYLILSCLILSYIFQTIILSTHWGPVAHICISIIRP